MSNENLVILGNQRVVPAAVNDVRHFLSVLVCSLSTTKDDNDASPRHLIIK